MISICFVCLGNICRSPTAEGVMLQKLKTSNLTDRFSIDSAGTSAYHVGERADKRSRLFAAKRGYKLPSRSRKFIATDFEKFDYIIAMDQSNRSHLLQECPDVLQHKIYLFRQFEDQMNSQSGVPDPYYGGDSGFDDVLDICERGCENLIVFLKKQHHITRS